MPVCASCRGADREDGAGGVLAPRGEAPGTTPVVPGPGSSTEAPSSVPDPCLACAGFLPCLPALNVVCGTAPWPKAWGPQPSGSWLCGQCSKGLTSTGCRPRLGLCFLLCPHRAGGGRQEGPSFPLPASLAPNKVLTPSTRVAPPSKVPPLNTLPLGLSSHMNFGGDAIFQISVSVGGLMLCVCPLYYWVSDPRVRCH